MTDKCEFHAQIAGDVQRHEKDICNIKEDIHEINLKHVEFNAKFIAFMEIMSPLPKILEGMKESMNESRNEIKHIKRDISVMKEHQEKKDTEFNNVMQYMRKVDDKGKVDLVTLGASSLGKIIKWAIAVAIAIGAFFAGKNLF